MASAEYIVGSTADMIAFLHDEGSRCARTPAYFRAIAAALEARETENARLREALEIIAGRRQCIDNLMSNAEIAAAALDQ